MTFTLGLGVALWLLAGQGTVPASSTDDLRAAKTLYASGSYEEALTKLSGAHADVAADEADQYRALCQLALGRPDEARSSIEELVKRRPLFKMSEADVSPRLITIFHEVRKQQLPAIARDLYAKGKANYEQKRYLEAMPQLKTVLAIFPDPDMADQASSLSDLKAVAEGFLMLSEAALATAAKAEAEAAEAARIAAKPPPPPSIASEADRDVRGPVEVTRPLPTWNPPNMVAASQRYEGVLRIVIDKDGRVESASILKSVNETYDPLLLAAARQWQYRPATKNGEAVKYQKLINITLSPR
jgi:TonB family protein